jgi:hypothetical protein
MMAVLDSARAGPNNACPRCRRFAVPQDRLKEDLAQLRSELNRLATDAPGRERLLALVERIEAELGAAPQRNEPLVDGLSSAITDFEVEHPQATAILQRIVATLSSMGI